MQLTTLPKRCYRPARTSTNRLPPFLRASVSPHDSDPLATPDNLMRALSGDTLATTQVAKSMIPANPRCMPVTRR